MLHIAANLLLDPLLRNIEDVSECVVGPEIIFRWLVLWVGEFIAHCLLIVDDVLLVEKPVVDVEGLHWIA